MNILVPRPGGPYDTRFARLDLEDDLAFLLDADTHARCEIGRYCPRADVLIIPLPDSMEDDRS